MAKLNVRSPEAIEREMLRLRLRLKELRAERRLALLQRERERLEVGGQGTSDGGNTKRA